MPPYQDHTQTAGMSTSSPSIVTQDTNNDPDQEYVGPLTTEQMIALIPTHPSISECTVIDCFVCAVRDCPTQDPMHYDDDGCTSCKEVFIYHKK